MFFLQMLELSTILAAYQANADSVHHFKTQASSRHCLAQTQLEASSHHCVATFSQPSCWWALLLPHEVEGGMGKKCEWGS